MPESRPSEYFAAQVDSEEFGRRFAEKIVSYRQAKSVKAFHDRCQKAYQYHFGLTPAGVHATSGITRGGEQGELAEIRSNHLRANSLTVQNLTTGPQIAWRPVATNRDSASTKQAYAAVSVLEYYWLRREVAHYAVQAVAHCIPLTEGYVFAPWHDYRGDVTAVGPDGQPEVSGDFCFYNPLAWNVMRAPGKESFAQSPWVAVCVWENRYELAALYPEHADNILEADCGDGESDRKADFGEYDEVPTWYFFHKKSPIPELAKGREAVILGDGTVLRDGALTYDEIPVYRVAPDEQFGTPFGYSQYHEGMGIQEAIDSLTSAILTNQDAFARQSIAVERGESFSPEDIGGMKVLYYTNKPPSALQLASSPAEAFKFVDVLKSDLQRVQGVNDAVQGQLPGDAKLSGAALALLSSQAIQQNSMLQSNYLRMVKAIGNGILSEWKKRTPYPRKIELVGKSSEFLCTEETISGDDISDIRSVNVDIGNPMQQTHAGKMELAQMYLQIPGVITSPEQIDQLATTGRMEHLTQSTRDELILILDENEAIADGETPAVMIHDDHLRHGREHRSTLASVAARSDPKIVEASIAHLKEHYKVFFGWPSPIRPPIPAPVVGMDPMGMPMMDPAFDPTDPTSDPMYRENMLILVGQQPPPAMPMGMPPGAPPGGDGAAQPPGDAAPGIPPGANPPKPPEPAGNQTNLPSMPTNPLSGEEYVPPNGEAAVPQ